MFTPSNMLQKYLAARPRDMYDIVGALMGYINADPYFRTTDFDEAIRYVLAHGVTEQELYAAFDKEIDFVEDESKWTEEYYLFARVYLKDNFCRKRIRHVKAVARKLHPEVRSTAAPVNTDRDRSHRRTGGWQEGGKKQQDHQENCTTTRKTVTTGIIVIGVVILMVVIVLIITRLA